MGPLRGPLSKGLHFGASAAAAGERLLVFDLRLIDVDFVALSQDSGWASEAALLLALPASSQVVRAVEVDGYVILNKGPIRKSAVVFILVIRLNLLILHDDIPGLLSFRVAYRSLAHGVSFQRAAS